MTDETDRIRRLRGLFDAVVDLPAGERRAALEAMADSDPGLVREVSAIIDEAEKTSPGLATGGSPYPSAIDAAAGLVGQKLGHYEIIRLVGLGGMGAVYEALRVEDGYQRRVAIKLVRTEFNQAPTLARFKREQRILARLQHRNIATLLDGGISPDGRPFLVMEYIEGEPITTWCDRRGLTVTQRLSLFRQVCAAVQHAHRNLVIHRDLKPGNILVTADGDVKLLDFGVGKLLDPQVEEELPLTRGGICAFTPEYASPEQIRGETLTTASDVYSLGAVLYELLTGRRAHPEPGSVGALQRAVLADPVKRPSAAATAEAAQRCGEKNLERLHQRLSGELDNIILLALRPEPELRYPSVEALADDLRCWLEGAPVKAQHGWLGYRLKKFLRRNRAVTSVTVLLVLALTAGMVATGIEARYARRAQLQAERVSNFLEVLLQSVRPASGRRDVMVSEVLDAASKRLGTEMVDEPEVRARLEEVIGQSEAAIGRLDEAQRHLGEAASLQEQIAGRRSVPYVMVLTHVASAYLSSGELANADSVVNEALTVKRSLTAEPDTLYASLLGMRGSIANARGDAAAAEQAHREVLDIRMRLLGKDAELVGSSLNNLAVALGTQGRWAAAESLQWASLAIAKIHHPPPSLEVTNVENSLATALDLQGKDSEAEAMYADVLAQRERLLGREHPDYASTLMNYAGFEFDRGRLELAADLSRRLLALRGGTLPDSHPAIASALQTLGRCMDGLDQHDEAARALAESLELRKHYLGADSWLVGSSTGLLGEHFTRTGDFARAEELLLEADAILGAALGPDHARSVQNLRRLIALYDVWPRPGLARQLRARLPATEP
ncbi:MAG: serine/threonine protein kinase [bacterium]|nr:serine/threonine protein kinase [bacterium]